MPNPILENIETRYLREYLAQLPMGPGSAAVGTDLTAVAGLLNQATLQSVVDASVSPLVTDLAIQRQKVAKTITVGSGGNFATINDALKEASKLRPEFVSKGLSIEVRLLSGFVMAEQVFIVQEDLSFVQITSVDATVTIQRSAINQNNGNSSNNWRTGTYPAFCAMRNGVLPYIKTLFAFDTSGTGRGTVGLYVFEGGRAVVARNCGITGAGWRGLYTDGGYTYARNSVWTGSGFVGGPDTAGFDAFGYAIRCSNNGMVMAREANVSGSYTGVYVSKGFVDCNDINASGCTEIGLAVTDNGYMTASGANASNCAFGFRVDQGANFYGGESSDTPGAFPVATGCSSFPLVVLKGSRASLDAATLSSTGSNAILVRNSNLRLNVGTLSTTGSTRAGVVAEQGSDVTLYGTSVSSASDWGVRATGGSRVNVSTAKVQGSLGSVNLTGGSIAHLAGATLLDGVTPATCNVPSGTITANGLALG